MGSRMHQWPVLAMAALALAGCHQNQSATMKRTLVPPARPFVFYDETGEPSGQTPALCEVELRKIVQWMATQTPDPIWLIRVKPSFANGRRAGVVAYTVPDEATSRIRVGKAYYVAPFSGDIGTWEYVQVSLPGQRFSDQFTKPSVTEMPFRYPSVTDPNSKRDSPMSQEEVNRIVDFLRQPSNYQDAAIQRALHASSRQKPYELPILTTSRKGSQIFASSGFSHGGLWGWGWFIRLESTAAGYRITSAKGPWIS